MNKRKLKSAFALIAICGAAAITVFVTLGLIFICFQKGKQLLTADFLLGVPSFLKGTDGILPNILNTLYMVFITLIIALPLGIGTAVFLNEYASKSKAVKLIEFAVDILAGIPSIIYGLVGMLLFVAKFHLGTSIIAGALTLVFVVLPGIVRTTGESLKSVPFGYREGALALGAGRWHTTKTVVLPAAINGILAGAILAVGRITGESAALLFTAGAASKMLNLAQSFLPGNSGATLTVALYIYSKERGEFSVAFTIALILILLTLLFNLSAHLLTKLGKGKA